MTTKFISGQDGVEFNPYATRVNEDILANFLRAPISGDLIEVPGIGPRTSSILKKSGVETTYQLFAKFLSLRGADDDCRTHCNKFIRWLVEVDTPPMFRNTITHVLAEKLALLFPSLYDPVMFVE